MYKLSPFLNPIMLKNIYYSLVYSHIVYAIHVWGSAGKSELDKIFILQKRAIRLISNKAKRPSIPGPLASTNPMFYKLEILKINDIFTLQIAKFIYKSLIGDAPENFHEWFKLNCDSHSYNTRSNYTELYMMNIIDVIARIYLHNLIQNTNINSEQWIWFIDYNYRLHQLL